MQNKTLEVEYQKVLDSLPHYNPAAICPKCDCTEVAVRYVPRGSTFPRYSVVVENMTRTCSRCTYKWHERVPEHGGAYAKQG